MLTFRLFFLLLSLTITVTVASHYDNSPADNEFAEFEEFEAEDEPDLSAEVPLQGPNKPDLEDEADIDQEAFVTDEQDEMDDDSEFRHFEDVEEFEGFDSKDEKPFSEPKITITKVPIHFRANWDSYWLEILMIVGLVVYFINFVTGKTKNTKLANIWLQTHKALLDENFSLVGDHVGDEERNPNDCFNKESENIFTLWCSGRTCCEGMLVELKLKKRQDLVSVISGIMKPSVEQIHVKVVMNKEDMDSFVFCVASKKSAARFAKELTDISLYCPERRSGDKHSLPSSLSVMSEIAEATSALLDAKVLAVLNKYVDLIDYVHFSDQYSGCKQPEDSGVLKPPETQKVLLFGFNVVLKDKSFEEAIQQTKPLMQLVFYCIEKVKRYRLSKEAKQKADKNRQLVEGAFLKSTHQARAEAAALKREERRRAEKEKIMAEEDPERQRRWEEREQKRQAKKRAPKMKQLKVKAL